MWYIMKNWLRFSNICVTINLNPVRWVLIPKARKYTNTEWPDGNAFDFRLLWLFIEVHIYFDDGVW